MIIKQPDSSIALEKLCDMLRVIHSEVREDTSPMKKLSILYLSSLIFSPTVSCPKNVGNSKYIVDIISEISRLSPSDTICIVRMAPPSYFPYKMRPLQQTSLNMLRRHCHVFLFGKEKKYGGFLNHAKFLVFLRIGYRESNGSIRIVQAYRRAFYGSTNFTQAGLARRGNFEEFTVIPARRHAYPARYIMFYIDEVYGLLKHRYNMYTNAMYLIRRVSDCYHFLGSVARRCRKVLAGTTRGELYRAFIEAEFARLQSIGFMADLPGKKLTQRLLEELQLSEGLLSIFDLEAMIPSNMEDAEFLAELLRYDKEDLRGVLRESISSLSNAVWMVENYLRFISKYERRRVREPLEEYYDEYERDYAKTLRSYLKGQLGILKKLRTKEIKG